MRKIAANYIYLPGYNLVKNGYVIYSDNKIIDIIDTGGEMREIPCLEFYGGMIVAGFVAENFSPVEGEPVLEKMDLVYSENKNDIKGLAVIQNADLKNMKLLGNSRCVKLQ